MEKSMLRLLFGRKSDGQRGVTAIMVAIMLVVLIGFAALAVDIFHLFVARNELQNAADAGALAGARVLYKSDGTVNPGTNQVAYEAAIANKSEKVAVEVNWTGGNEGDIQRGHWSFKDRKFTPNASLAPVALWNVSNEELDANLDFINALRVQVRRKDTPVASFFARIFGFEKFILSAEAVAYIGFAGELYPKEIDIPVAICEESILLGGEYSCNIGRMKDSSNKPSSSETAFWTNFELHKDYDSCRGTSSADELKDLVMGNPQAIFINNYLETNTGVKASVYKKLLEEWKKNTDRKMPWKVSALVIDCSGNNDPNCKKIVGAVVVNIMWMKGDDKDNINYVGADPQYKFAPWEMKGTGNYKDWSAENADDIQDKNDGKQRWNSFAKHFNLKNLDGSQAPYKDASFPIYFLPDCNPHEPTGRTGGPNFGVLAKIPVLVK